MAIAVAEQNAGTGAIDGLVAVHRRVRNKRAIIDADALDAAVQAAWIETDTIPEFRIVLIDLLKQRLADGRDEVKRRFMTGNDGADAVRATTYLMDTVITAIYRGVTERIYRAPNPTLAEQICVVAQGGYGRGELAPFSDLDILFLLPYKQTPRGEQVVEYMLYVLWDLGLKVGHATRSIEECLRQAKSDMTIRTALLETRYLIGERSLYADLRTRFDGEIVHGTTIEFVEAKLQESDDRHKRLMDSRYVIEPNIKEGKGGLRDLHKLFWISKYAYQIEDISELVDKGVLALDEAKRFAKAQKLFWTIRCHLHYLSGRAEERLTMDVQSEIAEKLGYQDRAGSRAVERFMKHYYLTAKDVGDLTRIFCAAIEAEHQRPPRLRLPSWLSRKREIDGFRLEGGRISVMTEDQFERNPVDIIRAFHVAQTQSLNFHPALLRLITKSLKLINADLRKDPEANRLFLEVLSAPNGPERILRRMNEAGVFSKFVPDFGRVVAQMQYDMYHSFTVDEHTIFMLGILHQIEAGGLAEIAPIATEVVHKVVSRRALYVAVLLHDIAKGRGGDHSILGEKVARRLGPRFGLSDEETETVAWLVRWHLLMSYAAFKRDVNDPKTIEDFCNIVQSPERLRLLLVLTVADIRAVGPNVWNGWKAALLRELFYRAEEVLSGTSAEEGQRERVAAAQEAARTRLVDWTDDDFATLAERAYAPYWLSFDAESHERQARFMRQAEIDQTPIAIDARVDADKDVTEVTIHTLDHPGLFARLTGALAASGANIVDARIFTLSNSMALDVFWVQDESRGAFAAPERLARMEDNIRAALAGEIKPSEEIAKRGTNLRKRARAMKVAPRVLVDNSASVTHTVIEVNGRDQPGLLYRISRALASTNVQIASAKISTYGESIVDVFYIKNLFGLKIDSESRLNNIRTTLLDVIDPEQERAQAAE
jgi:[protein-PII] uridylyltransferase